jgi:ABC-type Fe3+-hydroxamate transport system substrate-binding protein
MFSNCSDGGGNRTPVCGSHRRSGARRFRPSRVRRLRPDLVLSFSDLQADIVAALIRQGVAVHAFNQRSTAEIFDMIRMLGALVGTAGRADRLVGSWRVDLPTLADSPRNCRGGPGCISRNGTSR